ncbi:hypothetical protein BGZ65_002823 [Modicella reniformis]|uniref:Uncharacterized protein n=1 Tax=Modicella reniformis TaxID=1440133 RepID=A0A9P6SMU8_9FUNG|nr:hypothetical protein BGZ65_002823 [Modicella reniformis]
MSDHAASAATQHKEHIEEKSFTHHSPPAIMNHRDSELTISADNKEITTLSSDNIDIEHVSATVNQEQSTLVDGPLYGWVVVFASFFTQMIFMGTCNIYGVYQVML